MPIENLQVGYGSIAFQRNIDPVPPSTKVSGNVTINNAGSPGSAAHYVSTHQISFSHKEGELDQFNVFSIGQVVPMNVIDTPYSEVELVAAQNLPELLRLAADEIEKQLAVANSENVSYNP